MIEQWQNSIEDRRAMRAGTGGPGTWTLIAVSALLSAASIGLQYAIGAFTKPNLKAPLDGRPTDASLRGSYVPLLIGRRRIGCVVGWAGDRNLHKGSYSEGAWHQLCVGPAYAFYGIYANGANLYTKTLYRATTPSGSEFQLDDGSGTFRIYWGKCDQPIDRYLSNGSIDGNGANKFVGVASRWPHLCYIVWKRKTLGPVAQWPQLEYEIETRIESTNATLTQSPAYIPMSLSGNPVDGTTVWINSKTSVPAGTYRITYQNGAMQPHNGASGDTPSGWCVNQPNGSGYYIVGSTGAKVHKTPNAGRFYPNQAGVEAAQHGASDTFSWPGGIMGLRLFDDPLGDNADGAPNPTFMLTTSGHTYVVTGVALPGKGQSGGSNDDGANPAHLIWQVLTGAFPHGMRLSPSYINSDDLENVGVVATSEKLSLNAIAETGMDVSSFLGEVMQDCSMTVAQAGTLLSFNLVRPVSRVSLPVLPDAMIVDPDIEILRVQGNMNATQNTFFIRERIANYTNFDITLDDDGLSLLNNRPQPRSVEITTITNRAVALTTAKRRHLELTANGNSFAFRALRGARRLEPGKAFIVPSVGQLRLTGIKLNSETNVTEITALLDQYSIDPGAYSPEGLDSGATTVESIGVQDVAEMAFIAPAALTTDTRPYMAVARIRGNSYVLGATVFFAADGTGHYTSVGTMSDNATGGKLNFALTSSSSDITNGPSITPLGPDTGTILDLTGNDPAYDDGQQLLIIDKEIMFLRRVTAQSGGLRLEGIKRARYGTSAAAHAVNAPCFILSRGDLKLFQTAYATAARVVLMKCVPFSAIGSLDISDIDPTTAQT